MHQVPIDSDINKDESFFGRSTVTLLDEKQWLYLQQKYRMTPRELQIARLVCLGFNNGETAKLLKIRHGTAKTHLRNIYRRVRVKNKITLLLKFIDDVQRFFAPSKTDPIIMPLVSAKNSKTQTASTTPPKN